MQFICHCTFGSRRSYRIAYLYFPLSGLLFATGVVCLITGAEARNNQLAITGKEFGFKVLKLWMIQNVFVALLCSYAHTASSAYLDGRLEHLRNQTSESRSAPLDTKKAASRSASPQSPPLADEND